MVSLIFSKNKLIARRWSQEKRKFIDETIMPGVDSLIPYYGMELSLKGKITVQDFMLFFSTWLTEIQKVVAPTTHGVPLEPFYEELNVKPALHPATEDDPLKFIEFFWGTDYFKTEGEKAVFELYGSYHGIGESSEGISYNMSFSPVCNWKNIPIRINDSFDIVDYDGGKCTVLLVSKKAWTLYDFLSSFFGELTFYGTPEMRDEQAKRVERDIEKFEEERNKGTLGIATVDELLLKLKKKQ